MSLMENVFVFMHPAIRGTIADAKHIMARGSVPIRRITLMIMMGRPSVCEKKERRERKTMLAVREEKAAIREPFM